MAESGSGTGRSLLPPSSAVGEPNRVGAQKAKAHNRRRGRGKGERALRIVFLFFHTDPVAKVSLLKACIYG